MGSVEIVPFSPQYLSRLLEILHADVDDFAAITHEGEPVYTAPQIAAMHNHFSGDYVLSAADRGHLYVALDEDMVVGSGGFIPLPRKRAWSLSRPGEIVCPHIDPAYRGHGIFYQMFEQVVTKAVRSFVADIEGYAVLDPRIERRYTHLGCEDLGIVDRDFDGIAVPYHHFSLNISTLLKLQRERKKALSLTSKK